MSGFPVTYDATFQGYPYVDEADFVDATSANQWVQAIQAIENAIGYGANGTAASPLYSVAYAATYSTITARIAALESTVSGGLKLNSSNANIQSIGGANLAGSTGLAADAGHVHQGQATGLTSIGVVVMWPGSIASLPAGYLLCNGQLISTSTYSVLFGLLGHNYGGAGGSFALPNYNDRFPIGINVVAGGPGQTGGSSSITTGNLPSHTHNVTPVDTGHTHAVNQAQPPGISNSFSPVVGLGGTTGVWAAAPNGSQYPTGLGLYTNPLVANSGNANIPNATTTGAGQNQPYYQPYIGTYFLIRAL